MRQQSLVRSLNTLGFQNADYTNSKLLGPLRRAVAWMVVIVSLSPILPLLSIALLGA